MSANNETVTVEVKFLPYGTEKQPLKPYADAMKGKSIRIDKDEDSFVGHYEEKLRHFADDSAKKSATFAMELQLLYSRILTLFRDEFLAAKWKVYLEEERHRLIIEEEEVREEVLLVMSTGLLPSRERKTVLWYQSCESSWFYQSTLG